MSFVFNRFKDMFLSTLREDIELNGEVSYKKNYNTSTNEDVIDGLMSLTQLNGEYMKNIILNTLFSCCFLTLASSAYAMPMDNNMSGNSSQMMSDMGMGMTENDIYPNLNSQDKAIYDQLNAQQRAFVIKMANMGPKMQMMRDTMMDRDNMNQRNMNPNMRNQGMMNQGMMNQGMMDQGR